ncbi:hypothetical protein JMF89_06970 [Clostridiaceae bacterium UIB06]|uniref:Uncharacterized protein n=1 Tax=Clostridium thailandense TaxID=2794346 RepID=A0A949X3H4_9CLOT|nr:hypothetical protein [Clostridium thailandense]MBV7272418.1 hypothetical protein [Clostridium thailandense]MCH5136942.1 hypothetical protein [Clostridiaceae bacterium UIB06]
MNKIYLNIIRNLKILKKLVISIINYFITFFKRKKTIDNMYSSIIKDKALEIKTLEEEFKNINNKNALLEKEIVGLEKSLIKKNSLILGLQDLLTKRVDN